MSGFPRLLLALAVVAAAHAVPEPTQKVVEDLQGLTTATVSKGSGDEGPVEHVAPDRVHSSPPDTENVQETTPTDGSPPVEGGESTVADNTTDGQSLDETEETVDVRREKSYKSSDFGHRTLIKMKEKVVECPSGYLLHLGKCHEEVSNDVELD